MKWPKMMKQSDFNCLAKSVVLNRFAAEHKGAVRRLDEVHHLSHITDELVSQLGVLRMRKG